MKYWRGFLTAAIIALVSWALISFASAHSTLIDMVYPYVTRMLQTSLAEWTGGASFVLWQVLLCVLIAGVLASGILMVLLKWNPLQWFGWVLTAISILFFIHTAVYGLNQYAGSVAGDIRMDVTEYTLEEMEQATTYFRDKANELADQTGQSADFDALANQAGEGFDALVYDYSYSIYAGSTVPVKKLGWAGSYKASGTTGVTVALTGESAVNPLTPDAALPFAICHEMAHRMCIAVDSDADFSAFLACQANSDPHFQYSGYLMAYRICLDALKSINSPASQEAVGRITAGENATVSKDLTAYEKFAGKDRQTPVRVAGLADENARETGCDLLVSWYIQEFILPTQVEQDSRFDPYDETQVDLTGIVNAPSGATNATGGQ